MLDSGPRAPAGGAALASAAILLLLAVCAPRPAAADALLDQVWVGGFAHDISDFRNGKESGTADVEFEIDSARPHVLRFLGAPRINATLALNAAGKTSFGGVGLVWDHKLVGPVRATLELGIDRSDGVAHPPPGPAGQYDATHRLLLGSQFLFREAGGLEWQYSRHWSLGLQYIHLSNGLILGHRFNQGINDVGLRLGYRFP